MKQFYIIDLLEEYPNVNFYSIRLEDDELTELNGFSKSFLSDVSMMRTLM